MLAQQIEVGPEQARDVHLAEAELGTDLRLAQAGDEAQLDDPAIPIGGQQREQPGQHGAGLAGGVAGLVGGEAHLAVALVLAVALGQLLTAALRWVDAQSPPPARQAAEAHPEPALDRQFLELLDGVRSSRASETYWRRVLWPRLTALAERLPPGPALVEPGRSRMGRLLGRGPALSALRALVSRLEERR